MPAGLDFVEAKSCSAEASAGRAVRGAAVAIDVAAEAAGGRAAIPPDVVRIPVGHSMREACAGGSDAAVGGSAGEAGAVEEQEDEKAGEGQ